MILMLMLSMMRNSDDHKKNEKMLELVRAAVKMDSELREKYHVGEKFRFIRDRLQSLFAHTEEHVTALQKKTEKKVLTVSENEIVVYVHLFNSQGMILQTWQKMVVASVFYDHSVNRPIYSTREQIEAFIRSKTNKAQHGFLTIAIPKEMILKSEEAPPKDTLGNELIKVKEGSLKFNRLLSFTHNGHEYIVNENGELKKKDNNH